VSSAHALAATVDASSYFWSAWSGLISGGSAVAVSSAAMISPGGTRGADRNPGGQAMISPRADGGERLRLREKLRDAEPEP